jgi:cyclopropane fatty-acyl-phospholipid synthase-like methyltransferase
VNIPNDIEPRLAQIPCLEEMIESMINTLQIDQGQAFRFLDLGGGTGTLSERFLDHFGESEGILIEASEPQRKLAQQRLDGYGDRMKFLDGNFARVDLHRDFGLLVSLGRFHQLGDIERRVMYRTD